MEKTLSTSGDIDVTINKSITDFTNTSKLFKVESIFGIIITDLYDRYIIDIGRAVNKIYPHIRDIVSAKILYQKGKVVLLE